MTRRRRLWILGIATLVLFTVLVVLDGRMQDAGGYGIVDFEVAFTSGKAQEIMDAWGAKGHDAAIASLWLDYLYLIAYALFLRLAIQAVGDGLRARGREALAAPAAALALLPLIGAACDAIEDAFLLLVLGGHSSSAGPVLAGAFATVKFACIAVAIVYLLVGLVAMALARRGAPAR
ncbi:MAG TPA: hypothetical protein VF250_13275 [Conexibacter sp.]